MSGKDRINIFPSRGAQTLMKGRLKAAEKGHKLLKSKADALQMRFRDDNSSVKPSYVVSKLIFAGSK